MIADVQTSTKARIRRRGYDDKDQGLLRTTQNLILITDLADKYMISRNEIEKRLEPAPRAN